MFKYEEQLAEVHQEAKAHSSVHMGRYFTVFGKLVNLLSEDVLLDEAQIVGFDDLDTMKVKTLHYTMDEDLGSNDWPFPTVYMDGKEFGKLNYNGTVTKS